MRTRPVAPTKVRKNSRASTTPPADRLAALVTNYRLAIEIARSAIRTGRPGEALEALDDAINQRGV